MNRHSRNEHLFICRQLMYFLDDIQPSDDFSKSGKALSIRVSHATKIELRLISDSDKKF